MSKYIIEIPDDVQYVLLNGQTDNKCYTAVRPIAELEELNSDYINEHYGELQDEAYQRGFEDGKKSGYEKGLNAVGTYRKGYAIGYDEGYEDGKNSYDKNKTYQRGLEDAWEAARRIVVDTDHGGFTLDALREIFGTQGFFCIMQDNTAQEAIDKIKAYDDKHSDRIEVGDEVDWGGDCFVVTRIYQPLIDKRCNGIAKDGSVYMDVVCDRLTKTGRHFDIASILEAMRK